MSEDTEVETSLRDDLASALAGDAGVTEAVTATPAQTIPTPAPEGETAEQTAARARDEAGRFAKAEKGATAESVTATPPADGAPPQGTSAPPPSWSATAKAKFAALDPTIQQEVLKREKDISDGKAQWDQKAERYNRLDAVLAPRRDRLAMNGVSDDQYVAQLAAADDWLRNEPQAAFMALARQYGVNLSSLTQGSSQAQPAQQQTLPPEIQRLFGEVNTLKQTLTQQQQAAAQAAQTQYVQSIDTFRADPKNLYFENVRGHMAALIRNGQAKDLQDAYDQATWASPEIRPLLLDAQRSEAEAKAQAARSAKVSQARYASGSVTGSPTAGSSPVNGAPDRSLRDELAANMANVS